MATKADRRAERLSRMGILVPGAAPTRRRRLDLWALAVGIILAVATTVAVRDGTVGDAERSVFEAINGLPDALKPVVWAFQLPGFAITPIVLAVLFFAVGKRRVAAALALAVPLKLFFERWVVKQLVERERPVQTLTDIAIVRDSSSPGLSFPSGHAIFAFAIAGLLAPYLTRGWKIGLYAIAILNGFARIYLGAHNPLDIVSGAAIGVGVAAMLNLVLRVPEAAPES